MAALNARMRRLLSDWEQIQKDFGTHKYIAITPLGAEPYERYHVTYFVKGIYLEDGRVITLDRHEVEIQLHAEYPRYKPKCEILTPIYHPNFRDGQICIGDIWGAGESLSDIIINIGDMIQYKSWNSYSPLSADAAKWALEHKEIFPVGNTNLQVSEPVKTDEDPVEIDLSEAFEEIGQISHGTEENQVKKDASKSDNDSDTNKPQESLFTQNSEDFEITVEELRGITYTPSAQRMQSAPKVELAKKKKINFKTILVKGLVWAVIGAFIGFVFTELIGGSGLVAAPAIARAVESDQLGYYYEYSIEYEAISAEIEASYREYCKQKGYQADYGTSFEKWNNDCSSIEKEKLNKLYNLYERSEACFDKARQNFQGTDEEFYARVGVVQCISVGLWVGIVALFVGLFMGIGEGVYYGTTNNILKYALIGAAISFGLGFFAGVVAQIIYGNSYSETASLIKQAFNRAIAWAILGAGIGLGTGLIKPEKRRVKYCVIGGTIGGFIGGFAFDYIFSAVPSAILSRGIGIVVTGLFIGLCIGLLEQVAKEAWLKVVRGEFEGKEYLVFAGTTSIGNNGQNVIVLFKDKLISPHHCDICLEGTRYMIVDAGSSLGTYVNGMRVTKQSLNNGDSISIGNSVLVFNTK